MLYTMRRPDPPQVATRPRYPLIGGQQSELFSVEADDNSRKDTGLRSSCADVQGARCAFTQPEVGFMGHTMSAGGNSTRPSGMASYLGPFSLLHIHMLSYPETPEMVGLIIVWFSLASCNLISSHRQA